ncbi:hypothetical protein [Micromonospora sp. SH-82]|uniref:hypothetical protein n=1 Tax=Micromonospora sp. SH-82 TaxID=3132938 RepID=UPI003EB849FF
MNRLRVFPVALTLSLLALTACGGEESTDAESAAAPTSAPAVETLSDKELCEKISKDFQEMQQRIVKEAMATEGEPSPALTKEILTEMEKRMAAAVAAGGPDSEVAPAIKEMSTHVVRLGAEADPQAAAADDTAGEKAAKDLNTACAKAGVTTNF